MQAVVVYVCAGRSTEEGGDLFHLLVEEVMKWGEVAGVGG